MTKNWQKLLTILSKNKDVLDAVSPENTPVIKFRDTLDNSKKFLFVHIPEDTLDTFEEKFEKPLATLPHSNNFGKILLVKEYPEFHLREGIMAIPTALLTNTPLKKYLEQYEDVRLTKWLYVYVALFTEHPFYQYFDEGNYVYSRFFLDSTGRLVTRIGKTKTAYQYISVIDNKVGIDSYPEAVLQIPYKKKYKEISDVFSSSSYSDTALSLLYKGFNILGNTEFESSLFEVDFRSDVDLKNIPKMDLLQSSKIKEGVDDMQQLGLRLSLIGDEEQIALPSNLILKKDRVVYAGQELYSSFIGPQAFLFDTLKCFPMFGDYPYEKKFVYEPLRFSKTVDEIDWDSYLIEFIKYNWIKAPKAKNSIINMRIGTIDVKIEYKQDRFYINDRRINKDEVQDVLLKALCARTSEDFNDILQIISKTSLEMHDFISRGLNMQLNIGSVSPEISAVVRDLNLSTFDISFVITRAKNSNYIELADKSVRIKKSRALMDLNGQMVQWKRLKEVFGPDTTVLESSIDIDVDANEMIRVAREKYVKAFEKSKKLLQEAVVELGAKITEWKDGKGVIVKGLSGNSYFIKASNIDDPMKGEPECSVYHYPSNTHICIVDKSGAAKTAGVDKLIARMYALKNDTVVAEHIHTLASYVK